MKRFGILVALLIILLIGGGLTTQLISSGDAGILPVLRQTSNPEAAVDSMVPWKAEQLFLAIGFILFNLIGMAVTLALVFWFIDRGIRTSRAEAAEAKDENKPAAAARRQQQATE